MPRARKPARTRPKDIAIQERRRQVLEFRKAGHTFEWIGDELGTSRSTAHEDMQAAMRDTIQEPADEVRRVELERLDTMLAALWPIATSTGDKQQPRAVEMCLSIMDRRAKLLGLDAPSKRVVDVYSHDAIERIMEELNAEIGALEGSDSPGDRAATGAAAASQ